MVIELHLLKTSNTQKTVGGRREMIYTVFLVKIKTDSKMRSEILSDTQAMILKLSMDISELYAKA